MKRTLITSAILAASLSFSSQAQSNEGLFYVTGGGALVYFDDDRDLDNTAAPWGGIGVHANEKLSFELNYLYADTDIDSIQEETEFDIASLLAIYRYTPLGQDSWSARIGASLFDFGGWDEAGDEASLRGGLGYEQHLSERFAVNYFADLLVGLDDTDIDFVAGIGLKYYFGDISSTPVKTKPVVKEQPVAEAKPVQPIVRVDADNDGVEDPSDMCPATPAGATVDAKGCEVDSDNDGVVDSKDKCLNTAEGVKVDETGCAVQFAEKISVNLNVQFANNSLEIESSYTDRIQKLAEVMKKYPSTTTVIEGHTDSSGSAAYNQQLSEKRANAVMQYIIDNYGIDADRLTAVGKGEAEPIADNSTETGRRENRRVVAVIEATIKK